MEEIFDIKKIKAIIGLGNPGAHYAKNRHSIGFRVIDELAQNLGGEWRATDIMETTVVVCPCDNHQIILIKPMTFMNTSGRVISFLQKKGIAAEEIVVIHDELEKEFGKMSIKFGGSARGHNGLKSIMGVLGDGFWRLRFGIGRPQNKDDVPQYVLTNFFQEEEMQLPSLVDQAIKLLMG